MEVVACWTMCEIRHGGYPGIPLMVRYKWLQRDAAVQTDDPWGYPELSPTSPAGDVEGAAAAAIDVDDDPAGDVGGAAAADPAGDVGGAAAAAIDVATPESESWKLFGPSTGPARLAAGVHILAAVGAWSEQFSSGSAAGTGKAAPIPPPPPPVRRERSRSPVIRAKSRPVTKAKGFFGWHKTPAPPPPPKASAVLAELPTEMNE
jgi:hypothetical protein